MCEDLTEVEPDFGLDGDCGSGVCGRALLSQGDGGEAIVDATDGRFWHFIEEQSHVCGHGFEESPLTFSEEGIESEARFTGAADACEHGDGCDGDVAGDIFKVMCSDADEGDGARGGVREGRCEVERH